ncbi:protease FtsH-inhibitory lysogeny factor CIII [Chimaeribacter arupi]|nr:protease FtsH-inhibitory lysogeny factor CIII [Chimaeribacter arupi]WKZ93578.1 protease FtsH-inhibitory lysogeny factor CIII [Chimaeribacter arupi]
MQAFAIAGATHMGASSFNNSLLDIITERLRSGWRSFTRSVRHP